MDNKYAYKTGDYSSQSAAMDANHFALEGCGCNGYALWVYMATVSLLNDIFVHEVTQAEQSRMGRSLEWRGSFHILSR